MKKTIRVKKRRKDGIVQAYHEVPANIKKQIVNEKFEEIARQLKKVGRSRIPEIGMLRVKIKKARPARMGKNPFTGEMMRFKAKPKSRVVKFRASKALSEKI